MPRMRKPTHPGEVLREDVFKPLGFTVTEAAMVEITCAPIMSDFGETLDITHSSSPTL